MALGSLGNTPGTAPAPIHRRQPHAPRSTAASPASPAPRHRRIPPLRRPRLAAPRQPRLSAPAAPPLLLPSSPSPSPSPLRRRQLRPGAEPCAAAAQALARAESAQGLCTGTSLSPGNWTSPSSSKATPARRSMYSTRGSLGQQQGPHPGDGPAAQSCLPARGLGTSATDFLRMAERRLRASLQRPLCSPSTMPKSCSVAEGV